MSLRHTADHRTVETNQLVEVKIYDSQFSGSPSQLKGTGSGWLSYTHQNLNTRQTLSQPIQKGEVKASVWIRDASQRTFRDQLLRGSEGQFKLELYIDSVLEWTGYVLPDLCEYTEDVPEQLSIVAKDFTLLKKDLFPLEDERETIITTIERCLANLGFGLQTVTSTSWIESNTTSGNDFLRQIYHETKALRDFADPDQQITFEEALDRILRNYGLILKQSGGKFRIDQISAYESATSVLRSTYNNGFVSQSTENARQSVSPITIDSTNRGNPGLKRVKNIFDHRTQSQVPELPSEIVATGANEPTFTFQLTPNDEQNVEFNARILAFTDDEPQARQGLGFGEADIQLRVGQYYWNGEDWVEDSDARVTFRLEPSRQGAYQGFASISTAKFPSDASAPITIQFFQARLSLFLTTQTQYAGATLEIDTEGISNSILYQLQQTGDFSEEYTHPVTFFGDGPLVDSPSALRYSTDQDDLTSNSWQRRGGSGSRLFHSNLLHEILDTNRGYRRIINATIKDYLLAYNVVRHDDTDFFYLGGTFDGYTGSWSVQLFEIDIIDEAEQIVTLLTDTLGTASGLGGFVNFSLENLRRLLLLAGVIGITTEDYDGTISEIDVDLNQPMKEGFAYWVINSEQLNARDVYEGIYEIFVDVEGYSETGDVTVPLITDPPQILVAPKGSLVILAPSQVGSNQTVFEESKQLLTEQVSLNTSAIITISAVIGEELEDFEEFAESIIALETTVDGLVDDVAVNTGAINQLTSRVTVNEGEIVSLSTIVNSVEASIGEFENQLDGSSEIWDDSSGIWDAFDQFFLAGAPAQAKGFSILGARVTQNENEIDIQATSITAIQSQLVDVDNDLTAKASAINSLDTRVTQNEGDISVNASAVFGVESRLTDAENDIDVNASSILTLDSEVTVIDGEVTNIKAKAALIVDADGTIGSINLTADGITGFSEIDIQASQVKINGVIFDDKGAMFSGNFDGTIDEGLIETNGTEGWALDRSGLAVFQNVRIRGSSSIDGLDLSGNVGAITIFETIADLPTTTYPGSTRTVQEGDVAFVKAKPNSLFRYDGAEWISTIDGDDLVPNSVTAGTIQVADLSAINASTGNLTVSGFLTLFTGQGAKIRGGEIIDEVFEPIFEITGTGFTVTEDADFDFTIGDNSEITNAGDDFSISSNGLEFFGKATFNPQSQIKFYDPSNDLRMTLGYLNGRVDRGIQTFEGTMNIEAGTISDRRDVIIRGSNITAVGNSFRVPRVSADPSIPLTGQIYYNTSSNELRYYNGTNWVGI